MEEGAKERGKEARNQGTKKNCLLLADVSGSGFSSVDSWAGHGAYF